MLPTNHYQCVLKRLLYHTRFGQRFALCIVPLSASRNRHIRPHGVEADHYRQFVCVYLFRHRISTLLYIVSKQLLFFLFWSAIIQKIHIIAIRFVVFTSPILFGFGLIAPFSNFAVKALVVHSVTSVLSCLHIRLIASANLTIGVSF